MISDRLIVINRCQSTLCRRVMAYIPAVPQAIEVLETGSDSCEHVFDPGKAVSLRRDVLVLHGIWTVGRHSVESGMDVRAHILADMLGFEPGEAVPVTEIPLQLVDVEARELTWQGVCTAARVARMVAVTVTLSAEKGSWSSVVAYLERWQHYVM